MTKGKEKPPRPPFTKGGSSVEGEFSPSPWPRSWFVGLTMAAHVPESAEGLPPGERELGKKANPPGPGWLSPSATCVRIKIGEKVSCH